MEARFWSNVNRTDDCWLWTGELNKQGYGRFWHDYRKDQAHRYAYELLVGPIPEGLQLDHRHTCPKNCVNPEHLRPATPKQNRENLSGPNANNKCGVRGVRWFKGAWQGAVHHAGQKYYVGRFSTLAEAEAAVIAKRLELFTHNDADREVG